MHLLLTARRDPTVSFSPAQTAWIWERLRAAYPGALGAVLLPDGVRLVVSGDDPRPFAGTLAAFRRAHPARPVRWEIPPAVALARPFEVSRAVREVTSAPCEVPGVHDPLDWLFSTHRGLLGAVANPWVQGEQLFAATGRRGSGRVARFHRDVCIDGGVRCSTVPRLLGHALAATPPQIAMAAAASVRLVTSDGGTRRDALTLHHAVGRALGHSSSDLRLWGPAPPPGPLPGRWAVEAMMRCLSDVRLRAPRDVPVARLRRITAPVRAPGRPRAAPRPR
jgi:hypothetical protein